MSGWWRVSAVLRAVFRGPRALNSPVMRRAVGPGLLGSVIGTGLVCYYQYHANSRTLPFAVHAEAPKVSKLLKVCSIDTK